MTTPHERDESIFEAALALPPEQRAGYLDQACAGDVQLRQRVEALLRDYEQAGHFMTDPVPPSPGATIQISAESLPVSEKPGDRIGHYKLLQQIGEGGCGVVYMAEQTEPIRRRVAFKVIKLGMDTKQVIARFEAERQALALMDHPNIAKVLDAGAADTGRPYFVMELVKGIKITEFCDQNKLSTKERLDLFIQVCHAIQHAHQKGIIHRDIKPSNVLVTLHDGVPVPKVIDFGIAKATQQPLTDKTVFTAFGQFIGTPAYMSPEQAELSGLDIDTRTDIYSLGVLLYELLTGKPPFDPETLLKAGLDEMRRIIRETEPPKPSTKLTQSKVESGKQKLETDRRRLLQEVRGDLDWIVMKCLEKDRTRRYETANDLAADIGRHLGSEPVMACPPSNLYRFQKLVRRNKLAFAAAGAAAAALMVGLGLASWGFVSEKKSRRRAEAAEATQSGLRQNAEASERKATDKLWDAYLAQARANRRSHEVGRRFGSLAILAQAAEIRPSLELRNEAIACLTLPDLRLGNRWEPSGREHFRVEPSGRATWSDHGLDGFAFDSMLERYAVWDGANDIVLPPRSSDAGTTRLAGYATNYLRGLRFSPDDRHLLVLSYGRAGNGQDKRCQVWDLNRKEVTLELTGVELIECVDFSPDSRLVAAGDTNGAIVIRDLASGQPAQTFAAGKDLLCVRFDPDGARLAASHGATVGLWEAKTGKALQSFSHPKRIWAVAWHPTGTRVATGGEDSRIYVWDTETGQTRTVMSGHRGIVNCLSFSHAGDLLASTSWDYTVKLWDPFTGSELVSDVAQGDQMHELRFSPDDRQLAYAVNPGRPGQPYMRSGNPYGVFEVATGRECRVMRYELQPGRLNLIPWIGFSPDARCLALVDGDGLRFWDAATAHMLAFLDQPRSYDTGVPWRCVAFHPTNGLLVSDGFGVKELPVTFEEQDATLRVGPWRWDPHTSDVDVPCFVAWIDQKAGRFAVACRNGHVHVLDAKTLREQVRLRSPVRRASVALSPDGQWLATGNMDRGAPTNSVHLFYLPGTNIAHKLPISGRAIVGFSPDGKWLFANANLYRAGSWQLAHNFAATNRLGAEQCFSFSPDGRTLALAASDFQVRLVDVETAEELATLEAPNPQPLAWLAFSPDGSQLAAACLTQQIQLWDLRALRSQLAAMKLDWQLPPLPAVSPARTPPARVIVNTNTEVLETRE
jgi:eukaryotic-like serine/threonine-protein kinase